jgi:hypothetical protein
MACRRHRNRTGPKITMTDDPKIGDQIEVIDRTYSKYIILGTVLELDAHLMEYSQARIRVDDSPALPTPEIWVTLLNWRLRTAR